MEVPRPDLTAALAGVVSRRGILLSLFSAGRIDAGELDTQLRGLEAEERTLRAALTTMVMERRPVSREAVLARASCNPLAWEDRREALSALGVRIIITAAGRNPAYRLE